jgi:hypothetical protein
MTDAQTSSADPLLAFILGLLNPLLKTTDAATRQVLAAYQAAGPDQLITIAQIVGLALTSLDTLRLSLPEDLSLSMKLRLRGNANALVRSSQRATAALAAQRGETAPRSSAPRSPAPRDSTEPTPPAENPTVSRQRDLGWATAMTTVAAEFAAELAQLPPDQQKAHLSRIGALNRTAETLRTPLKSRLLNSAAMCPAPEVRRPVRRT